MRFYWIGALLGGYCLKRFGPFMALLGSILGCWIESKIRQETGGMSGSASRAAQERAFLWAFSAMMSKMAKMDGRISEDEVRYCERIFDQLGLRGEKRAFCIRVFQTAKSDAKTVYDYAAEFAQAQPDRAVREIVYEILWNLACIDGALSSQELDVLENVVRFLKIDPRNFTFQRYRHGLGDGRSFGGGASAYASNRPDPYDVLGCSRSDSDDVVKKAYRQKAKELHPDLLRQKGVSDEFMKTANEQMARLNAAWDEIRRERGL